MKLHLTLKITNDDGQSHEQEVIALEKGFGTAAEIGLTLDESKALLASLQETMIRHQIDAYCKAHSICSDCGYKLRSKGHTNIRYRTVFGDISMKSPRFHHCACTHTKQKSFSPLTALLSEHVSPEMLWLESKWASLVSFGASVRLLKDVLPVGERFNAETSRRHLHKIARRLEDELGDERYAFVSSPHSRRNLPNPSRPMTVGLDGGYVRARDQKQSHFEVTVGKSMGDDCKDRYIGLVQSLDEKPKRRMHEILKEQGWQENQHITFMTDGGDTVLNIARHMAPASEHLLDWFHITMRITVLGQYIKGLTHHNPDEGEALARELRQIKGYLWNGNLHEAVFNVEMWVEDIEILETTYASIKALRKAAGEFQSYITNNAHMIPNYAERRRYGERVSTGFVESTVNTLVGKRFGKRQQMQWSKEGAHLLLQIRTRTLDQTLRSKFEEWYPAMKAKNEQKTAA